MKNGKYTSTEWNKLLDIDKQNFIDISNPLPDKMTYAGIAEFSAIIFHKKQKEFFAIDGSMAGVHVKNIDNMPIKKVYGYNS